MNTEKLILASGSPRRSELLTQAGIPFEVIVSNAEEMITKTAPAQIVEELSYCKAKAVAQQYPDRLVLGADTVVVLDGEILGKPKDEKDAVRMLTRIQGRDHQVFTGVTLMRGTRVRSFHAAAEVHVVSMTSEEICSYAASGDPMDKAGAYGIQGKFAVYIDRIVGEYNTIVGLPICAVYQEIKNFDCAAGNL